MCTTNRSKADHTRANKSNEESPIKNLTAQRHIPMHSVALHIDAWTNTYLRCVRSRSRSSQWNGMEALYFYAPSQFREGKKETITTTTMATIWKKCMIKHAFIRWLYRENLGQCVFRIRACSHFMLFSGIFGRVVWSAHSQSHQSLSHICFD